MSHKPNDPKPVAEPRDLSRRALIRRASLVGVGALGAGLVGCKQRPDDSILDLSTDPQLGQVGGTISGTISGLLRGEAAQGVSVRLVGVGQVETDESGQFEVRVERFGEYEIQFNGSNFAKRVSRLLLNGNVSLTQSLLETDAGLPAGFLDQYARASGPNEKEGVTPRTPGASNRWTRAPLVRIYRRLADSDKESIGDARLTAMQASIAALFAPLTASRIGFPIVELRNGKPPSSFDDVPAGVMVIGQTRGGTLETDHLGSLADSFSIAKGIISCQVDSTIEFFNRTFAHGLGGYVVGNGSESILNPAGRATLSDRDVDAATFLYTRVGGNRAPDQDPPGVLLNA